MLPRVGEESRAKDVQALGLLVTEVLSSCSTATSMQFRDFAKNQMLLPDVARLPSLNTVLENETVNLAYKKILQTEVYIFYSWEADSFESREESECNRINSGSECGISCSTIHTYSIL